MSFIIIIIIIISLNLSLLFAHSAKFGASWTTPKTKAQLLPTPKFISALQVQQPWANSPSPTPAAQALVVESRREAQAWGWLEDPHLAAVR